MWKPAILIAEDDATTSRMLQRIFTLEGFDCRTAMTAEDVVSAVGSGKNDVVLLDLNLPGMTTAELVASLALDQSRPPIVIFSACQPAVLKAAADVLKPVAVLQKPAGLQELLDAVGSVTRSLTGRKDSGQALGE
jgi:DNA-binding response OmpR family regulator